MESPRLVFCICGSHAPPTTERYIQCASCGKVQHVDCMISTSKRYTAESTDYKCERCNPDAHVETMKQTEQKRCDASKKIIYDVCGKYLWQANVLGLRARMRHMMIGEVAFEAMTGPAKYDFSQLDESTIPPPTETFTAGWQSEVGALLNNMFPDEVQSLGWQLKNANNALEAINRLADGVGNLGTRGRFEVTDLKVLREMLDSRYVKPQIARPPGL